MKFLNTVERKYIAGYGIVGIFSIVFMIIAAVCSHYVSRRYKNATEELISLNNLESSVDHLNSDVNSAYTYLMEAASESYRRNRQDVMEYIKDVDEQQSRSFIREVADAVKTVETYVKESDLLMEKLLDYFQNNGQVTSKELEDIYGKKQEVYTYVTLRFQNAYSAKLNILQQMENQLNTLQKGTLYLQIVLLAAAFLASVLYLVTVIRQVSNSIIAMQRGVEAMQKNVKEAQPILVESRDEFEKFANAFNEMTRIIQMQMRELEENADIKEQLAEMEIKNLRMFSELQRSHLDFLQSRVNPHFLFNTLNMMSSLARLENADKCAELMEITASFLRYNLDNISKTVTLRMEVKNLMDYVAIQRYRYEGRYQYYFQIEEECMDYSMPCMVLQPMVENAIQHGIAMKMDGGWVKIRVYQGDGRIFLEVSDNGVGMTDAQISNIQEEFVKNQSSSNHIGIHNIYRRLRLFYHEDIQFSFFNMDPGLKISISLPRGNNL